MNTHWNTVWSNGQSQDAVLLFLYNMLQKFQLHLKFHVSRSGVRIPVKAIFVMWLQWQLIVINQSIVKVIWKIFSIDVLLQKVGRRKKNRKKWSWLGFGPQTWKHGNSYQSINRKKLFKKYSPLGWPLQKVKRRKKAEKLPWPGFEPQTWKCGIWCGTGTATARCGGKEGKRPMMAYCFTQCSNGCSLGSLLFSRQDDHAQWCRVDEGEKNRDQTRRSVNQGWLCFCRPWGFP